MCKTEIIQETEQLIKEIEELKEEWKATFNRINEEIEEKRKKIAHNIAFAGKVEGEWNVLRLKGDRAIAYPLPKTPKLEFQHR